MSVISTEAKRSGEICNYKRLMSRWISCLMFVAYTTACLAQTFAEKVNANGTTTLTRAAAGTTVNVTVQTSTLDPSSNIQRFPQCTQSKIPCSLTERISASVNGAMVPIPRSAYADLGDINSVAITFPNHRVLVSITGGDASESYIARLSLEDNQLRERRLYSAENSKHAIEVTRYRQVSTAD